MALDPYARLNWRGVVANRRTIEMLEITELRGLRDLTPLRIPQGSYTSGVSASGGTHSGGGALDISVRNMTSTERDRVVRELRETSFAAWYRPYLANVWPAHIHAIAIGDKEMSAQAAWQVQEYKAGRNGLANQGPDTGPDVPIHVYRQDIDMSYYGPERWDGKDLDRLFDALNVRMGADKFGWDFNITSLVDGTPRDASTLVQFIHKNGVEGEAAARSADAKADQTLVKLDEVLGKLPPPPVPV
jgi:hypothetical protein